MLAQTNHQTKCTAVAWIDLVWWGKHNFWLFVVSGKSNHLWEIQRQRFSAQESSSCRGLGEGSHSICKPRTKFTICTCLSRTGILKFSLIFSSSSLHNEAVEVFLSFCHWEGLEKNSSKREMARCVSFFFFF